MAETTPHITAIDIFCGAGGLSLGLKQAGIGVACGIDIDPKCVFPFEANIDAPVILRDITEVSASHLMPLWPEGSLRMLAGCAPCQPFSSHRRGADTSNEKEWSLIHEFGRLIRETNPDFVTMENVPRLSGTTIFADFVKNLKAFGFHVDWGIRNGMDFGLAQNRRRLILVASKLGPIAVPLPSKKKGVPRTVRNVIGNLRPLKSGETDGRDPMHAARQLSELNIKRIRASTPGGTWKDWPTELLSPCHTKKSGASFKSVYARMQWDKPSPTITTQSFNFGTGRFGHPEQDRPISLREAAMLQGFPKKYKFLGPGESVQFSSHGRLIGNAVPPPLAKSVGKTFISHANTHT